MTREFQSYKEILSSGETMKFQIGDLIIRTENLHGVRTTSINVITKTDVKHSHSLCVCTKDFTSNKLGKYFTDWLIGDIRIGSAKYYPVVKQ